MTKIHLVTRAVTPQYQYVMYHDCITHTSAHIQWNIEAKAFINNVKQVADFSVTQAARANHGACPHSNHRRCIDLARATPTCTHTRVVACLARLHMHALTHILIMC